LVVLDEATQSTCTASCIPISKGEKVVLAGDHRQLPPFSATDEPPETAQGLSLFEHLYAEDIPYEGRDGGVYEGVGIRLETQYRMNRDIMYYVNKLFYDGGLKAGEKVEPLSG
ncbi:MAG: AAA domain-containing protein, partial [Halobacteria archaeon]|nr:AAA domain-containing protein [Halobacteria archaeon]